MSNMYGQIQQANVASGADGGWAAIRVTRDGIPFAASWKQALLLEGRCFSLTVGSVTSDGDIIVVVGGGNGTTIDHDQPEFGIGVPLGTSLIPLQIDISCQALADANDEVANILVIADCAASIPTDGTKTAYTPLNLLDAYGVTSVASAFTACTADITNPTVTRFLASQSVAMTGAEAAGFTNVPCSLHWNPEAPPILTGPCSIYGYWGGTGAASGTAIVIWAEVPSSRYAI